MTDFKKLDPAERAALAQRLRAMLGDAKAAAPASQTEVPSQSQPRPEQPSSSSPALEPIAIVGIGCRLPAGGNDPASFWHALASGRDGMVEAKNDRFNVDSYYDTDQDAPGKMYTRHFGLIDRIDEFDARFFGISPREARSMDPQQRVLLEVAWQALEDACQPPSEIFGSQTGVFIGLSCTDYFGVQFGKSQIPLLDSYSGTGCNTSVAAGRLSYFLGAQGPAMVVDTACSSSLVALHLACQSLRAGECNLALAGGVSLIASPAITVAFCRAHMLAPNGPCRAFDKAANGYMRGEGCGVLVLKRLSAAVAAGDNIYAVVRGTAINQDGRSSGLTAPNGPAQQAVIKRALQNAGVAAHEIGYLEAHGTGTPLGDPIELQAATAVLAHGRAPDQPLVVGSAKTNIGHAEAAAGVAGVIKVALALKHEAIPPHLHFRELNPNIAVGDAAFTIPTALRPWPRGAQRRYGGISSFGFSGTNAHVVLEEAPPRVERPAAVTPRASHLLALSARSEESLRNTAGRFASFLSTSSPPPLADVCASANAGRTHFEHRLAVTAPSSSQLAAALSAFASGADKLDANDPKNVDVALRAHLPAGDEPKVGFVFTGAGSQYPGMGKELYATEPVFKAALDRASDIVAKEIGKPLLPIMFGVDGAGDLNDAIHTHPAMVSLAFALGELWKSWGVRPSMLLGHSLGEYGAAIFAGVMSLEDGLHLVCTRARLAAPLAAGGEMLAAFASEEQIAKVIAPYRDVAVATINGPENVVLSGAASSMARVLDELTKLGIVSRPVNTSGAYHSPLLDPILDAFGAEAARAKYSAPRVPMISNLTGAVVAAADIAQASYWRRHLREPVRFAQGLSALIKTCNVLVEIGPHPTLLNMGRRWVDGGAVTEWLPSLERGKGESQVMLASLGGLFTAGAEVRFADVDKGRGARKVSLPPYAFEKKRYWVEELLVEPVAGSAAAASVDDDEDAPRAPLTKRAAPSAERYQTLARAVKEADASTRPARIAEYVGELIARVMGVAAGEIPVHGDFATLGMDSLMTMDLVQRLKRDVDISLSMAALVQARTVERLSNVLAQLPASDAAADHNLVDLRAGERAMYLVHPSGGGVLCYLDLARLLAGDRGVRAFQARGLLDGRAPIASIEEMARAYVEQLKKRQPRGPYALGGWSMGGVVAYEMAQQLRAAGDVVDVVGMIDSWLPSHVAWPKDEAGLAGWFMRDLAGLEGVNVASSAAAIPEDPAKQLPFVLDKLKELKAIPAIIRPDQVRPLFDVFKANIRALRAYDAKPYDGRVGLLRATTQLPDFLGATDAWSSLADVRRLDIPGTHYDVVRAPSVTTLASSISTLLDA